ncbi:MAG: response regulator [Gammaproteobacteria bacterium]|nr:response regulator [Gammaproteobacteria bacterium]
MKKQVMIVDNDSKFRQRLHKILEKNGFEVLEAKNGQEALIKANQQSPDLIISELKLPKVSGHALLRRLKTNRKFAAIPFVVCSDFFTNPSDEDIARSVGADAFINKPAKPTQLLALIKKLPAKSTSATSPVTQNPDFESEYRGKESHKQLVGKLESKILELTRANQELTDSERHLKSLLNAIPIGMAVIGTDGKFIEINPAGVRLFRARRANQFIGQPLEKNIKKNHRSRFNTLWGNVLAGGEDLLECEVACLEGESRWVACTATPLLDSAGVVESVLLAMQDIDYQKSCAANHPSN